MLAAVASVFHGGQLIAAGPRDGEKESRFFHCLDVVPDRGGECEEVADVKVMLLVVNCNADVAFEHLDGDRPVRVVLFDVSFRFHGDEDDSQVVLLEESSGIVAGLPRLILFGVADLLEKIELRHFVDHGAVLLGSCHVRDSFVARKFMSSS